MPTNFIFVTGGVMSGLGKGVTTASIGRLLKSRGYAVTAIKIDPYINADAGTMNPTEHGEVFVTCDGGEIDQDLGTYERFLDINIPREHNITTGQIYNAVIRKERKGDFLGQTVEAIPHVTDEIKKRIKSIAEKAEADFVLVEIGGTVGEYQNELFYRAANNMKNEGESALFAHVVYLPVPPHIGEQKTKPAQQSLEDLGKLGIRPDFLIGRSPEPIDDKRKEKLQYICGIKKDHIISNPDVKCIYKIPLLFEEQDLADKMLKELNMPPKSTDLGEWKDFIERVENLEDEVSIALVGKYFKTGEFKFGDSYISVIEAIKAAAWHNDKKPHISWINSEDLENGTLPLSMLKDYDGIIVPGGFGRRGFEGKIMAAGYARENDIPYLGLCLGLQMATVDYARSVCGLKDANSTEVDIKTPHPVIKILPEQEDIQELGGTMRLGDYPADLKDGTMVWELYGRKPVAVERHRHRFEVNPDYHDVLQDNGLVFSGMSTSKKGTKLVEYIELKDHPFFAATQAHPEFTSRPLRPNPLFDGLVKAAIQ